MPIRIRGVEYLHVAELAEEIGVTRQTLWRWRKDGVVPQGNRFRRGKTVFSPAEVKAVRDYAFRVEPILDEQDSAQVSLFDQSQE